METMIWEVARASLAYVRDTIVITRGQHADLLDALIFTATLDANMTPVNRDRALDVLFGGVDVSAPDALRRRVSMNGVAQSLRLPFETVRRRLSAMARAGLVSIDSDGVVVPRDAVTSAAYMAEQRARYDRGRRFYGTLKALNALDGGEAAPAATAPEPPVRAANRALSEYTLRACNDLIALTGDMISSRVLLELALASTRGLDADRLAAWTRDPAGVGRPIRVAALSQPMEISDETVRRRLHDLAARGFCRRGPGGLVATAPAALGPRLAALVEANRGNVQRLFVRLRQLGVLAAWDREMAEPRAPAAPRAADHDVADHDRAETISALLPPRLIATTPRRQHQGHP
jgi:hypothetical protein